MNRIYEEVLAPKEFQRLSELIHEQTGIKLPFSKKIMVEGRIRKRLKYLGLDTFSSYIEYLFSAEGMEEELVNLIDVITTNKTDFFREPSHFDFLVKQAIPQLITSHGAGVKRKLMVWSAGCSTGEEAYTLAMIISQFGENYPGLDLNFNILATDISTKVLEIGNRAVYPEDRIEDIPMHIRKKFLLRSKDRNRKEVRVIPQLRGQVKFRRINFLQENFGFREYMDIIFFRNVIIYFDKATQEKILKKIISYLLPGGFLFMGHSETILELKLPLKPVAPTIYMREPY